MLSREMLALAAIWLGLKVLYLESGRGCSNTNQPAPSKSLHHGETQPQEDQSNPPAQRPVSQNLVTTSLLFFPSLRKAECSQA